jgi:CubicO group peptidase (beta-lactamase class C family)
MLSRAVATLVLVTPLLLAISCQPVEEADSETATIQETDAIEAFLSEVMERFSIPGLTASIVRFDGEDISLALGVRSLDSGEAMAAGCFFHFASVSKPFVATAVMQLVEQGKIDLDQPVKHYLPYFELDDPRHSEITIRQMLNHSSGMPDVMDYEWDRPQLDEGAAERYVRSLKTEKMIAAPGERFRYSNMAFDTLGDVIAKVSGVPFESYVKDSILIPLGMTGSSFIYHETDEAMRTQPHTWRNGLQVSAVYPYNRRHAPSSTLNSSVTEMAHWLRANLNRGELDGHRILADESYELLWTPSPAPAGDVGLSWFIGEHRGERTISHGGGDLGYTSYLIMVPERRTGIVLATNYDQSPVSTIARGLLDIVLGYEPELPKPGIGFDFAEVYLRDGLDAATTFYRAAENEQADRYIFHARQLNRFGYYLLEADSIEGAIEVFSFNLELYPENANCHDSLGDAYRAAGDTEQAADCYRQALAIDPDLTASRRNLEELGVPVE